MKQAILPIWNEDAFVIGELLAYALLTVALHTGRNATPLLEMGYDCLRAHPKDNSVFLVLWKRRGHSSKVALRAESATERRLESTPTIKTNIERLIRRLRGEVKKPPRSALTVAKRPCVQRLVGGVSRSLRVTDVTRPYHESFSNHPQVWQSKQHGQVLYCVIRSICKPYSKSVGGY